MKNPKYLLSLSTLFIGALLVANQTAAASKTWLGTGPDDFWSTAANWTSIGAPVTGDDVVFDSTDALAVASPDINSVVDSSFTGVLRSLKLGQTNGLHRLEIQSAGLTISGNTASPSPLFVGSGTDEGSTVTLITNVIKGTALTIDNPSGDVVVRQGGATSVSGRRCYLDLRGLDNFSVKAARLHIALDEDGANPNRRPTGSLFLAKTNQITLTSSGLGYQIAQVVQQAGIASTNLLGQVNFFNVNSMRFGGAKTANTKVGFGPGWVDPSVTFRNTDGVSRQGTWYIADDATSGSSGSSTAFVDFSAGTVDALVDTIYVGRGQSGNNATYFAGGNGTLTFNSGRIDVNTLELGYQLVAGSSAARGAVNVLTNGVLKVNKDMRLARDLGPGTSSIVTNSTAFLTINGGTVQVAGNVVDGGGLSTITLTNGGTLDLQPAGDTTPGDVAVGTLNFGEATITNFASLSLSNLNPIAPKTDFTMSAGQGLSPIGRGKVGTMTVNGDLTLNSANLYFDLGDPFNPSASDSMNVAGTLTLGGVNSVYINPVASFGTGSPYTLMTYGSAFSGNASNLKVAGAIAESRYTFSFDASTAPSVTLTVGGTPPANLTWSGNGSDNTWDLKGAQNWDSGSGPKTAKFFNLDSVTFDDTGSATSPVNVVGTLLPSSVTINGAKSYTFAGSGKIGGSCNLSYGSAGTLTVLTTNDYSGNTDITAGTVQLGDGVTADGVLGSGWLNNYTALIFNAAVFQDIANVVTGYGTIVKKGPGVTRLSGANSFSSGIEIQAGTLQAGNASAFGDNSAGVTNISGGTLDLGGQNIVNDEPFTVSGVGVGGAGAVINSGPLGGSLQNLVLAGPTTFGGSASWSIGPSSETTGLQAGGFKVTKIGANSVGVSHGSASFLSETALGDLDIQAGTFNLVGYVNWGDTATTVTVRSNATLEINNTGDNLTNKPIVMEGGASMASRIASIALPQYCALSSPVTLGGKSVFDTLTGATILLNGEVSGSGSLVKGVRSGTTSSGLGTVVLGASNSFTGDLRIETGTVALTNDASVSRAASIVLAGGTLDVSGRTDLSLTLAGNQALKGNGTIIGTLVSPSGTTVEPGGSIGDLNVAGDVTLRGTTSLELTKAGSQLNSDQIVTTGSLDLGGTLNVSFSGDALSAGDKFTLFAAGTLANQFDSVNLPAIAGVVWTNKTAIDGSVEVLSAAPSTPPQIGGGEHLADGNFRLAFSGTAGAGYSVRASTNVAAALAEWTVLTTGQFGSNGTNYVDLNATNYPQRYYRVTIP